MEQQLKKFLQFNNKNVYFISKDGVWWIAIKPICEAIGVDFEGQRKNFKNDKILSELPSIQTVVAADNKLREMLCLPEFYVYGWLFSIQSDSPDLQEYKWKCYDLLYNYFHGTITERTSILKEKTTTELEIEKLEKELAETPTYKKLQELKAKVNSSRKALKKWDREIIYNQLELWKTAPSN